MSSKREGIAGLGIRSSFSEYIASFLWKNERMSDSLQKTSDSLIHSFLVSDTQGAHFWWATWAIRSHSSFLVSNLSDLLTSLLKKREGANRSFFKIKKPIWNILKNKILTKSFWANCSFIMSDLSESLTVAHLSWAPWAICSRSLFWYEQPERFAHSRSFVLRDLSESLAVAHLI